MDTKWNSTGKDPGGEQAYLAAAQGGADRVEEAEVFRPYTGRKGQIRAVLAFLAFFLGVCLVLGSLGAALGRWACQRDAGNLLAEDWQETAAFRREISDYLREFLELGAGEDLGWYSQWYETSEGTAIATDWDRTVTATAPAEETPLPAVSWDDPDVEYRDDSNVLYRITGNGYSYTFSNSGSQLIRSTLPEGYNFLLVFQDSKVSIWKDGEELDVYGDGVYDGDSDWFVPGYDNFPAGDNVSSVKVYIAVRETPVQYYNTSWGVQTSRMYRAYRSFQESREFWLTKAALLGAGVLVTGNPFLLFAFAPVVLVNGGGGMVKILLLRLFRKCGLDVRPPSMLEPGEEARRNPLVRIVQKVRFPLHDHCKKELKWSNAQVLMRFVLLQAFLMPTILVLLVKIR